MSGIEWIPYTGMEPPTSVGKLTLEGFLDAFLDAWAVDYFEPLERAFQEEGTSGKSFRSVIHFLGNLIQSGVVTSYARPVGGGSVQPIDAALWEIDDFLPRFRVNAFNPIEPFDPSALPTHHIFVSEPEVEAFLLEWSQRPSALTTSESAPIPGEQSERLLRLPDVLLLTGLSRSTLYSMIKRGSFPAPIKIGERSSAWRHGQIVTWMAERRSA